MRTKMLFAALTALTMVGCNNEVDEQLANNGRTPLQVKGGVEIQMTRAINDQWEANDAIGIYMVNGENAIVEGVKNFKYVTAGADGNFSANGETAYLPDDGSAVTVKAYYPQGTVDVENLYSIDLSNQEKQAGIDLMAAQCDNVTKDSPAATLSFSHKLAKVILNITADKGIETGSLKVKISNQKPMVKYNVLTGALTTADDATEITLKCNGTTAEAILAPNDEANVATERTVTFMLDGKVNTTTIPASTTFAPGKKYSYNVNLKLGSGTEAGISDADIHNWEDGTTEGDKEITVDPSGAPEKLYVVGSGCAASWNVDKGIALDSKEEGIYEGTLDLNEGEIKIAQRNDMGFDCKWYNASEENAAFTPGTSMTIKEQSDDYKWNITAEQAGSYKLTVNITNNTLSAQFVAAVTKKVYLVGDGCDAGWDMNNAVAIEERETDIFFGQVTLKKGAIKIAQSKLAFGSTDLYWYMPTEDAAFTPGTPMPMQEFQEGHGDNKWTISEAGKYDITINASTMTLSATAVVE